jgi:hypothetical protein
MRHDSPVVLFEAGMAPRPVVRARPAGRAALWLYACGRRRRVSRRIEGDASVGRGCKIPIMSSLSAIKFL